MSDKLSVQIIGTRGYPSYYGGFETAVRIVAPDLVDLGWDVTVYGRPGMIRPEDPCRDSRVRSVTTQGLSTKSLSTLSYGLTATLRALLSRPDVVLVMNVANGFWLPLLRLRGIPTVVNVDGMEWRRAKWGPVGKFVFIMGARLTARFATQLVFDSRVIAEDWRELFHREGVFIPYGASPPVSRGAPLGLEAGSYILMVARLVPENTVNSFIKAARELADSYPVVVVGGSPHENAETALLREAAARTPRLQWLGQVSDDELLFSLWEHCGVYFHGHSVGGTNPALVQAMACGSPTVARDTPYNREVLGVAGLYVADDPGDIRAAIEALMKDEPQRERMSEAVRVRQRDRYTWKRISEDYHQALIGSLAGE